MIDLEATESRYDRQELITWWDQPRLQASRVLVVGAGALGNELCKNLALLGIGHLEVIDLDIIERSNLARCVLFSDRDQGHPKAEVAAAAASALNPDITTVGHVGNVLARGLGWVADFDVVLGGLDNREARLWVGQACRKLGIPWIDGAIEGLRGLARVFLPDEGACYECTLGETDRAILAHRRSCALLSAEEIASGKMPTNATTASIIAAVQVQEAVKILVGRPDLLALRNEALMFNGDTLETYKIGYTEDEFCLAHDRYGRLEPFDVVGSTTMRDLLKAAEPLLGEAEALDLEDDLILTSRCPSCDISAAIGRPLASLSPGSGSCARCGSALSMDARRSLDPLEETVNVPLASLGLPADEVITVRRGTDRIHYRLRETR